MIEALDAADRALVFEPSNGAASYDRALALDLLGLDGQASIAWQAVARNSSSTEEVTQAWRRLAAIAALQPPRVPPADAGDAQHVRFAQAAPLEAQLHAWDTLLAEWGTAILAHDSTIARSQLAAAAAVGDALSRDGHDASVSRAVASIGEVASNPRMLRKLAACHEQFARAQAYAVRNDYATADSLYRLIQHAAPPSPSLLARVTLAHANALIYALAPRSAAAAAEAFLRQRRGASEPLLDARAHWYVAVLQLRAGHADSAMVRAMLSKPLFERAGDVEGAAGTVGLESEILFQAGDATTGYDRARRALLLMRGRSGALWRNNELLLLGRAVSRAGLLLAARDIEEENAIGARNGTRLVSVIEARLARARSRWQEGDAKQARSLAGDARRLIAITMDTSMQTRLNRDVNLTLAEMLVGTRPDSAARMLTRVIAVDRPLNYPGRLIPALVARAAAKVALHDDRAAEGDLAEAAARFDATRVALQKVALRRAVMRQARSVYDSLIVMYLRRGEPAMALAALERSRVAFGTFARTSAKTAAAPSDGTSLDYALIGDELLVWAVAGRDTFFYRNGLDTAAFASRVERVRSGLELGVPMERLRPDLQRLYTDLLAPVAGHIVGDRVRIVADAQVEGVPFAALWDARRRQHVVERYATGMSPTLDEALHAAPRAPIHDRVVIVADPAVQGTQFASLADLPGAASEGASIAMLYQHATLLANGGADSLAVANGFANAELIHFAGHAVLDDAQPWRSVLAVRPRGISAEAIATMNLRATRLVVLSGCETARAPDRTTGGFSGLTDAFLVAGAKGVVGSLWRVDDDAAAQLMTEFHATYRESGDAARALRNAQVKLLRSGNGRAGIWAAFRLAGN